MTARCQALLRVIACSTLAASALAQPASSPATQSAPADLAGVARLRADAAALEPLAQTELGRAFLRAAADLPTIAPRTLYRDPNTRTPYNEKSAAALSADARQNLAPLQLDEDFYYNTKYGSPLAYLRAIDMLGQQGVDAVAGQRVLDFGYGGIGPLRLLASLGAEAVGVDVDPLLTELYSEPGDTGRIAPAAGRSGPDGRVTLVHGRWPAEEAARRGVGDGYDLILSKNTLKRGYIHPERPVDPRRLVNLGVDDAAFLKALYDALRPGGRVLIYNICPSPSRADEPYKPHADGRSPFDRAAWEAAGFRVRAIDVNDDEAVRRLGRALGWHRGEGAMDLERDLFAWWTLVERPEKR